MAIGKVIKQPADVQDYDISFVAWLASINDIGESVTAEITGIDNEATIFCNSYVGSGVIKVWVSGGTSGVSYKVTVTLTTDGGRVKQVELIVKVKET